MPKPKNTPPSLVPLLTATTLILLLATGYLFKEYRKIRREIGQNPAVVSPTISIPQGWQTIESDIFGFSFRLPPSWKEIEHSTNFQNFFPYQAPDKSQIQVIADETDETTLQGYLSKLDTQNSTSWEGLPSKKVLSSENTTIGGYPAIVRKEDWLAAGFTALAAYVKISRQVFIFNLLPYADTPYDQTQAFENFYQILSSFKTF